LYFFFDYHLDFLDIKLKTNVMNAK
jgi:hypothetical protein